MTDSEKLLSLLSEIYNHSADIQQAIKNKTFYITACQGINADFYAGSTGNGCNIPCLMATQDEALDDLADMALDSLEDFVNGTIDVVELDYAAYKVIYHDINKLEIQSLEGETYGFQDADSLCGHNLRLN
jgi:hypothetical protein